MIPPMKDISKIFFRGLITFLPLAATIYIIYSGIVIVENMLGNLIRSILPPHAYIPGLGFMATLILIFLFGLLLNNYLAEKVLRDFEVRILKVPFIKAIYSPLRDLMNLFSKNESHSLQKVVLVKINNDGIRAMGLVTRESFDDLHLHNAPFEDRIAVYIPLSYGLGGYTLMVKKEDLIQLDIPIEKAMSLAITGWVKSSHSHKPQKR